MATNDELYRPAVPQTPLAESEQVRYSFRVGQGKKNWLGLHYEQIAGVCYDCHLTNTRLILESNVMSAQGFFVLKALTIGLSVAARAYGYKHTARGIKSIKSPLAAGASAADAVRDQSLSIPYDQISHVVKSLPCWLRIVLKDPPPNFDPHSLVFVAGPLPGRVMFKSGWSAAADVLGLFNTVLQDHPHEATIIS